jgi:hypothetical protein
MIRRPAFHVVTEGQRQFMALAGEHAQRTGRPPTIREIASAKGVTFGAVYKQASSLRHKGVATKQPRGQSRNLAFNMPPRIGDLVLVAVPRKC